MEETTVSQKGQVVIPKEFRDMFGIEAGGKVIIEAVDEGVLIMKKEKDPVKAMTGMFEGRFKKSSTEIIKEIRKDWDKRIEKFEK